MKDRKEIKLKHASNGTIILTVDDVTLPKRIRDSIHTVTDTRFKFGSFELEDTCQVNINQPIFFEWQKIDLLYTISNENSFKPPFHFFINKEKQFESNSINDNNIINGSFSLKNAVGFTSFIIEDSLGSVVFKLDTEVFPQKLEYKEDFKSMILDITKIIYNLIYDYLQKTYAHTKLIFKKSDSLIEWRAILEMLFVDLERSLDQIIKHPKSEIEINERVKEVSRIKRTSRNVQKWMLKNQRYLSQGFNNGIEVMDKVYCTHLPESKKRISYNTFENRFVAWAIQQIISKIDQLIKFLVKTNAGAHQIDKELTMLKNFRSRLRRRLNMKFLKDVDVFENQFHFSTVLTMAAGYKDFYHKYLLLKKALSIFEDDQFKMDYKDIATLYEYWCFLKIVHLLKEDPKYNLVENDLIKVTGSKFIVKLKRGKESRFVFEHQLNKERYTIFFNKSFSSKKFTSTFTQRPDYSIQFKKEGYENPFWYILDAKYRFNRDDNDKAKRSSYDAPDDAIGQLHRYRDAILHQMSGDFAYKSAIKNLGGLILYPYPLDEEKYKAENKYFKSIEEVNIGALPLAPGKEELFKSFLDKLFSTTPETHYERFLDYDKSNYETFLNALNSLCLIGIVKEDQSDLRESFYTTQGIYNVPLIKDSKTAIYRAKYIALYSVKRKEIIGFAPVTNVFRVNKAELVAKGAKWKLSEDNYTLLQFDIAEWVEVNYSVSIKSLHRGFRYTNLFALKEMLSGTNRNVLNLNDFNSIRLWKELNTIDQLNYTIIRGTSYKSEDGLDKTPLVFRIDSGFEVETSPTLKKKEYYINKESFSLEEVIEQLHQFRADHIS